MRATPSPAAFVRDAGKRPGDPDSTRDAGPSGAPALLESGSAVRDETLDWRIALGTGVFLVGVAVVNTARIRVRS